MKKTKVIGIIILLLIICLGVVFLFIANLMFFTYNNTISNDTGNFSKENLVNETNNNTNLNNTQAYNNNELPENNDLNFWGTARGRNT